MTTLTPQQRALTRHALGLPNHQQVPHRNHFYCRRGTLTFPIWQMMVDDQIAIQAIDRDDLFYLTRAGAEAALDPGERLDTADFPS